ncbi:MAG TPA: replicative DNA helicase [Acidimicrobiales bacterium]|nr:replicative DNA helicase [Acidimicrobiales bacterium]
MTTTAPPRPNPGVPADPVAEAAFLGAALASPEAVSAGIDEDLAPEDFYRPQHGHIWSAALTVYRRGDPVDVVSVGDQLGRDGLLGDIGGHSALTELLEVPPSLAAAAAYARTVLEHATLRRVQHLTRQIHEEAGSQPDDVAGFIDRAQQVMAGVTSRGGRSAAHAIADVFAETLAELEDRLRNGTRQYLGTGIAELDAKIDLRPGHLIVVGARPGHGKTAVGLRIVRHCALTEAKPALLFSLEMPRSEMAERLVAGETGVELAAIRKGRLTQQQLDAVLTMRDALADKPLDIVDESNVTMALIRSETRRAMLRHGRLGCVVVDYVQLTQSSGRVENRQLEVAEISMGLKRLAREFEVPVIALSQVSRACEMRSDKRPLLADLRESGQLEADADAVLLLYRDEQYNEASPDRGKIEINIAKQRQGQTGTVITKWDGPTVNVGERYESF